MKHGISTLAASLLIGLSVAIGQEADTAKNNPDENKSSERQQPRQNETDSENEKLQQGSSSSQSDIDTTQMNERRQVDEDRYPRGDPNSTGYGSGLNMGTGAGTGRDTINHRTGSSSSETEQSNKNEIPADTAAQDPDNLYPRGNPNSTGYGSGLSVGTGAGTGRDTINYRDGSSSSDETHRRRGDHTNSNTSGTLGSIPTGSTNSGAERDVEKLSIENHSKDTTKSKNSSSDKNKDRE
ncbi:MAG TPA: hypothetical protein VD927_03360 [Chryseosolibacter sp.]|nr:hypothetical protein [Chryseosolibacter sp.]